MEIKIRKADMQDLEAILELNDLLSKKEYKDWDNLIDLNWTRGQKGKEYFSKMILDQDKYVILAEDGEESVGYLAGGLSSGLDYRVSANNAELENMFVREEYRSQGVGAKLVENFLQWCREKQVQYVSVTAYYQNEKGANFYRKMGFKERDIVLEQKLS